MFQSAFPHALERDAAALEERLELRSLCPTGRFMTPEEQRSWRLPGGEALRFPYRVYLPDSPDAAGLPPVQAAMLHCLFSRSCDGYVRQRHIQALLDGEPPEWALPYIVEVCGEYVVQILDLVYSRLRDRDTSSYAELCRLNLPHFLYVHARMISYWNEFYRWGTCRRYRDYVGRALFQQCFGYTRSLERVGRESDMMKEMRNKYP